jgi:hypothetical protein
MNAAACFKELCLSQNASPAWLTLRSSVAIWRLMNVWPLAKPGLATLDACKSHDKKSPCI